MRWLDGITELDGHKSEQAPGDDEGQGSLACCSPRGRKEADATERLQNNNDDDDNRLFQLESQN